jgi:hypothetical protein
MDPSSSARLPSLSAFFAAADRLFARAPWEAAHDGHVLGVDAADFGWAKGACACMVGTAGDHPGLMVFRSLDEYLRFAEQVEVAAQTGEAPPLDVPVLSINFDPRREAPRVHVKRARALGIAAADPQGFPWLQRPGPGGSEAEVADDDYAFAAALLDGLDALLRAHPDLFERDPTAPPVMAEGASEGRALQVRAPHPDAPWEWGEGALEYYRWWEADAAREEYLALTPSDAAEEAAMADDIARLFSFKIDYQGGEPFDFDADDIGQFLLSYFPEQELVPLEDLPRVPGRIASFVRWLGVSGRVDEELAESLADDALALQAEFLVAASDPALFGDEKMLVVSMKAAGIDVADQAAVDRFVTERLAQIEAARAPVPRKWVWTPGTPAPDPRGPCPCGSGKRYKKCCLSR